jgi:hypothetical protein
MDRECAEALRDRVNAMLKEVSKLPIDQRPGGVNWADLMVRDVCGEVSYLHDEEVEIFVDVEEASPQCTRFFTEYLNEPGVTVRCEW